MAEVTEATRAMRFASRWRPAQARVLDALETHLGDRKLHVVAPPGAGKTLLGLELFRRLGKPALVLSPTTAIQQQWVARLEHFLEPAAEMPPPWTSLSLDAPRFFTSATYQALHTRFRRSAGGETEESNEDPPSAPAQDEIRAVAARLRAVGVRTLILDEAHHLRRQWWRALALLIEQLGPDVTTVSLTATPPYDVLGLEWARYEELCGPIDEEISVPELVREGTLCPHQDYIWAVEPAQSDTHAVRRHDAAVSALIETLLRDDELLAAVARHPWMREETLAVEEVLARPERACALLLYLRARGRPLPRSVLELLGWREDDLPDLDLTWWEILVASYLDERSWPTLSDPAALKGEQAHRSRLRSLLRRDRLLLRRELQIAQSKPVRARLSLTSSKIDACIAIHRLEAAARGDRLRQVMLTDYIDEEILDSIDASARRLSACAVFVAIARRSPDPPTTGLLTGRAAVMHVDRIDALRDEIGESFSTIPVPGLDGFVRCETGGSSRLIAPFTRLLERGDLRTLVATRSLLGKGWDAPCVSSLVLASFVGSFVLSNQMRGRALRIDPASPRKVATIWHLVALDPSTPSGNADLLDLERRFTAFVGLSADGRRIESGYARLMAPTLAGLDSMRTMNEGMVRRFGELDDVPAAWARAIESAPVGRILPTVATRTPEARPHVVARTLQHLLFAAAGTFVAVLSEALLGLPRGADARLTLRLLLVGGVVGALLALPGLVRYGLLSWRHLPLDGSVRQVATAVLEALMETTQLGRGCVARDILLREGPPGIFRVSLATGTFLERSVFADSLQELLGPIQNPRYLITRRGEWWRRAKTDHHAVPATLARDKKSAEALLKAWRRHVGPGELVFTRTPRGRQLLVKARARAFSRAFSDPAERLDEWR